jgi:hypothetical protein
MFVMATDVGKSSHVNALFATSRQGRTQYDFDPTTSLKKSGKTRLNNKDDCGFYRRAHVFWEDMDVVGTDSGRAEIVWWL